MCALPGKHHVKVGAGFPFLFFLFVYFLLVFYFLFFCYFFIFMFSLFFVFFYIKNNTNTIIANLDQYP